MLDEKGRAMTTTTWQDNHSGYRRHKLMTKELGNKIDSFVKTPRQAGARQG